MKDYIEIFIFASTSCVIHEQVIHKMSPKFFFYLKEGVNYFHKNYTECGGIIILKHFLLSLSLFLAKLQVSVARRSMNMEAVEPNKIEGLLQLLVHWADDDLFSQINSIVYLTYSNNQRLSVR
jgi:hypothetical protein